MKKIIGALLAIIGIDDIKYFWKIRTNVVNNNRRTTVFEEFICKIIRRRYSAGIPITSDIEPFYTPHNFYGIFISQGAKIGTNCTIFQHVTIGSNNLKGSKTAGYPTIKNNVFIGAGSIIVGRVTIGENVIIGAGCVVTADVPDNATVVSQKPRIITHEEYKKREYLSHEDLVALSQQDHYIKL